MQVNEDSLGHRKRLREKFLKSGLDGFQDYEIVELLLSLGIPRRDCKHQAKEILRRFKTLRGVMEAPQEELQKIKGVGPHGVFGIKFMHAVASEFLKEKSLESSFIPTIPIMSSKWLELFFLNILKQALSTSGNFAENFRMRKLHVYWTLPAFQEKIAATNLLEH